MNLDIVNQLLQLQLRDLDTRKQLLADNRLYDGYADEMQLVHTANARHLDRIIEQHGWPGLTLVGVEGCRAAWFVAQHSICTPDLQRKFLELLTAAAKQGDAPMKQVALLTDRIRFNEGRPQVYGTVLDWDDSGQLSCEVETPDQLDQRRDKVGLPPFDDDLLEHRANVAKEGGKPPEDMEAYKQRALEWARGVGWR